MSTLMRDSLTIRKEWLAMSTLISHDEDDYKALVRHLTHSDKGISYATTVAAGLDTELLQETVDALKPYMDNLRGYKTLDWWFTEDADTIRRDWPRLNLFPTWFEESGLKGRFSQVLFVLNAKLHIDGKSWGGDLGPLIPSEKNRYEGEYNSRYYENAQRITRLRVFMTRKGKWIIWVSWPVSVFRIADDLDGCLRALDELMPVGATLTAIAQPGASHNALYRFLDGHADSSHYSVALGIRLSLIELFRSSIELKRAGIKTEESALGDLDKVSTRLT